MDYNSFISQLKAEPDHPAPEIWARINATIHTPEPQRIRFLDFISYFKWIPAAAAGAALSFFIALSVFQDNEKTAYERYLNDTNYIYLACAYK